MIHTVCDSSCKAEKKKKVGLDPGINTSPHKSNLSSLLEGVLETGGNSRPGTNHLCGSLKNLIIANSMLMDKFIILILGPLEHLY